MHIQKHINCISGRFWYFGDLLPLTNLIRRFNPEDNSTQKRSEVSRKFWRPVVFKIQALKGDVVSLSEQLFSRDALYTGDTWLVKPWSHVDFPMRIQRPVDFAWVWGTISQAASGRSLRSEMTWTLMQCGHIISQGQICGYSWFDLLPKDSDDMTHLPIKGFYTSKETPGTPFFQKNIPLAFKTWRPIWWCPP